jgi:hypothetical protein
MTLLLVVTISALALAAIMSAIAWRIAAAERRRSSARVAALAREIHAPAAQSQRVASFAARSTARWDDDLRIRSAGDRAAGPELFALNARSGRSGITLAIALGAALLVALLTVVERGVPIRGSAGDDRAREAAAPAVATAAAAPAAAPAPLELVALGHDRDSDQLTVRGIVRNPAAGAAVDRLTAVVLAFDADGGFLTTGRAIIESSALRPGGESTFVVAVPGAAAVARYRVSFRSGDRVVPHIDRRDGPTASS